MDQAHEKSGDIGDIRKIHKLQSDLHSTTLRLQAVQRNYDALSRVIRDKQQQAIKVRMKNSCTSELCRPQWLPSCSCGEQQLACRQGQDSGLSHPLLSQQHAGVVSSHGS
jgi:hypothetical protein